MAHSLVTIDLGAIRHNARVLSEVVAPAELWAVVKADGYGHGALDVAGAALDGGADALCVATVGEALPLRDAHPGTRILVLGPTHNADLATAREAGLELVVSDERLPEGVAVHLKLDTGMGRWGLGELPEPGGAVVGLMTHLATADSDRSFAMGGTEGRVVEGVVERSGLDRAAGGEVDGHVERVLRSARGLCAGTCKKDRSSDEAQLFHTQ